MKNLRNIREDVELAVTATDAIVEFELNQPGTSGSMLEELRQVVRDLNKARYRLGLLST